MLLVIGATRHYAMRLGSSEDEDSVTRLRKEPAGLAIGKAPFSKSARRGAPLAILI